MAGFTAYEIDEHGRKVPVNGAKGPAGGASPPPRGGPDWSLILIKVGGLLAVVAFGGLFWLVNGGFSVRGLEALSALMGTGGALFWRAVSAAPLPWRFDIPGLPPTQPLIPWVGVVAASLIQVGIVLRLMQRRAIPPWVTALGLLLSGYDLVTTFFGFGTLQWVQRAGPMAQIPLTLLFTFGLELLIGFLLRQRR